MAPGLGTAFRGAVVPAGVRLGSFSIDATVVLLLAAAVAASTRSVALTSVVIIEAAVALVVWEARTGLTVGHAVLHLRTARDDRPWSPGAVRELVRAVVVGAGALAGGVGAWVVLGSGGLDRTGRGRTWADRAGKTVVVRVTDRAQPAGERMVEQPPRPRVQQLAMPSPTASGSSVPSMVPGPTAPGPVPSRVPGPAMSGQSGPAVAGLAAPGPAANGPVVAGPALAGPAVSSPPGPAAPRPRRLMVGGPTAPAVPPPALPRPDLSPAGTRPTVPPAPPGPGAMSPFAPTPPVVVPRPAGPVPAAAPPPRPDVTVLLVFDTGQRDQLPFGTAAVLGRDPALQVASDRLVVVRGDAGSVSKSHLRVEHTADGVWLTDLGSTNGTHLLVDGPAVPLAPRTRTRIDGVVRVAVGQRVLMVSYMVRGGRP